jgi:type III secretion protein T
MENLELYNQLADKVLVLASSTIRIAVAFLIMPIFSDEIVPALIRNSLFIALAIIVVYLQSDFDVDTLTTGGWIGLFAKEIFVGVVIGFFFGLFLWAFEAAGTIIDTQIGASMAMVYDPLSGHEVTLYGDFLGRWVNFVFIAAGGLLFLVLAIFESYVIWPVSEPIPDLKQASVALVQDQFGKFVKLILLIASPIMVVIFMIDLSMGMINRFAKRMDILFISLAIKGLAALLMLIVMVPVMVELLLTQLDLHKNGLEEVTSKIIGAG